MAAEDEDAGHGGEEAPGEAGTEQAGGDVAGFGARVAGVDIGVEDAVEGHAGRAGADHGDDDPDELPGGAVDREAAVAPGQEGAGEGKWQRKDRVLELDHVERHAQALEKHLELPF